MNKLIKINNLILPILFSMNLGASQYISMDLLSPGQIRYSLQNVRTKAENLLKNKGKFDSGRSSLSISNAIPVILGPNNLIILVDSHHEFLAAKSIGDLTVPIQIKDNLKNLSKIDFFMTAKANNYIYPFNILGEEINITDSGWYSWDMMQDDPNRLFASLVSWKCFIDKNGFKDPNAIESPIYPLWIKRLYKKFELAFIEFKIATVLYHAGLSYDYSWGLNPNSEKVLEFTEKARSILNSAFVANDFELLTTKTHSSEIIIE